jgi:hypothetical protein
MRGRQLGLLLPVRYSTRSAACRINASPAVADRIGKWTELEKAIGLRGCTKPYSDKIDEPPFQQAEPVRAYGPSGMVRLYIKYIVTM